MPCALLQDYQSDKPWVRLMVSGSHPLHSSFAHSYSPSATDAGHIAGTLLVGTNVDKVWLENLFRQAV